MKNWKYSVLLVPLILFLAIFLYAKKIVTADSQYISNLNLDVEGKIVEIYKLKQGHGFGIIKIKLLQSNFDYYKPSNESRYFGLIENGFGKIVVNNVSTFNVGDIFKLKGKRMFILRNGAILKENKYGMPLDLLINPYHEIDKKIDRF